jgi:hypothetical protein
VIAPGANAANRSGRKSALAISLQPALVGWLSHYFIRVVEMGDKELLFDFRPFSLGMQPVFDRSHACNPIAWHVLFDYGSFQK